MSVHRPLRGTMKRAAIQFELKELNNDVDPERDAEELARIISEAIEEDNRRQLIISGIDPDGFWKYGTLREYQDAVQPLRPLAYDETDCFFEVAARYRREEFLLREIDAWDAHSEEMFPDHQLAPLRTTG